MLNLTSWFWVFFILRFVLGNEKHVFFSPFVIYDIEDTAFVCSPIFHIFLSYLIVNVHDQSASVYLRLYHPCGDWGLERWLLRKSWGMQRYSAPFDDSVLFCIYDSPQIMKFLSYCNSWYRVMFWYPCECAFLFDHINLSVVALLLIWTWLYTTRHKL